MQTTPPTPSEDEFYKLVTPRQELLKSLLQFLRENYDPEEKFRFSKKDGWTIFFRKCGKALTYINFRPGGFAVTVVIGATLADNVKESGVSKETFEKFQNAYQFHDGRWLNFNVTNKNEVEDIKKLLLVKKKPKK